MTKTSEPRTFSSSLTRVSPLCQRPTTARPSGASSSPMISAASWGWDVPAKICSRPSTYSSLAFWPGRGRRPPHLPRRYPDHGRAVGHIPGDHRSGAGARVVADADRCAQNRVAADKGPRPDVGLMLSRAVEVGGDGAGADVGVGADRGVADVAEVPDLDPRREARVLDLGEIADVRPRSDLAAGRARWA